MVPTKVTCIISQLTGGGGEVGFSGLGDFPSSSFPMDKHQCRNSQLIEDDKENAQPILFLWLKSCQLHLGLPCQDVIVRKKKCKVNENSLKEIRIYDFIVNPDIGPIHPPKKSSHNIKEMGPHQQMETYHQIPLSPQIKQMIVTTKFP